MRGKAPEVSGFIVLSEADGIVVVVCDVYPFKA